MMIKCETCKGEGKNYLFTSYVKCNDCNGTGAIYKDMSILSYFTSQPRSTLNFDEINVVSEKSKMRGSEFEKISKLAEKYIPSARINIYGFTMFQRESLLDIFNLQYSDVKIHVEGYQDFYKIYEFFKILQNEFGNDENIIVEIGGSIYPKIFHNISCEKCTECEKGIIYGFNTVNLCEHCDGAGEIISDAKAYSLFIGSYELYEHYRHVDLCKTFSNSLRLTLKDKSNLNIRSVTAPPFEFDSEFCLRKLANRYLKPETKITQTMIFPYVHLESLAHCPVNLFVKIKDSDDILGSFKLFKELRKNYKNAISLSLGIVSRD